jgi:hypothetical protein
MKKFEKKIVISFWNEKTNVGSLKLINGLIESRLDGDWSEYDEYEEVRYSWNLNYEYGMCDLELEGVSLEDIKEFVGDGICIEFVEDDRIWYNVSIKDNKLIVDWVYIEI